MPPKWTKIIDGITYHDDNDGLLYYTNSKKKMSKAHDDKVERIWLAHYARTLKNRPYHDRKRMERYLRSAGKRIKKVHRVARRKSRRTTRRTKTRRARRLENKRKWRMGFRW